MCSACSTCVFSHTAVNATAEIEISTTRATGQRLTSLGRAIDRDGVESMLGEGRRGACAYRPHVDAHLGRSRLGSVGAGKDDGRRDRDHHDQNDRRPEPLEVRSFTVHA
jgi:hypothetical protein